MDSHIGNNEGRVQINIAQNTLKNENRKFMDLIISYITLHNIWKYQYRI